MEKILCNMLLESSDRILYTVVIQRKDLGVNKEKYPVFF